MWSAEPERAKCDVLAFRFFFLFPMGAGEAFHVLSVNNFASLCNDQSE